MTANHPYHYIFPVPIIVTFNGSLVAPPCPSLPPSTHSLNPDLILKLSASTVTSHEHDLIRAYQHRLLILSQQLNDAQSLISASASSFPSKPALPTINAKIDYADFDSLSASPPSLLLPNTMNPTLTSHQPLNDWDALHNVMMMPTPSMPAINSFSSHAIRHPHSRHPNKLPPPPPLSRPLASPPSANFPSDLPYSLQPIYISLHDMGFLPDAICIALEAYGDNLKLATDFCLIFPSLPKPIPPHPVVVTALKSLHLHFSKLKTKDQDEMVDGSLLGYCTSFIGLIEMGFDPSKVMNALVLVNGNQQLALDMLMDSN